MASDLVAGTVSSVLASELGTELPVASRSPGINDSGCGGNIEHTNAEKVTTTIQAPPKSVAAPYLIYGVMFVGFSIPTG